MCAASLCGSTGGFTTQWLEQESMTSGWVCKWPQVCSLTSDRWLWLRLQCWTKEKCHVGRGHTYAVSPTSGVHRREAWCVDCKRPGTVYSMRAKERFDSCCAAFIGFALFQYYQELGSGWVCQSLPGAEMNLLQHLYVSIACAVEVLEIGF